MEKAKRARKAETPKQPSLSLKLRAPYLYPDPARRSATSVAQTHGPQSLTVLVTRTGGYVASQLGRGCREPSMGPSVWSMLGVCPKAGNGGSVETLG
jgi:hypothetical protein